MKRRIETTMLFDFTQWSGYGPFKGIPTTLPISEGATGQNAIYLLSVEVKSEEGGQRGSMRLVFDVPPYFRDHADAHETMMRLYETRWRNGDLDFHPGLTWFSDGFKSSFTIQNGEAFCESAIWRVVAIVRDLGVTKEMFVYPKISQSTFIWVPKSKATARGFGQSGALMIDGWVEYGVLLAQRFELGRQYGMPPKCSGGR